MSKAPKPKSSGKTSQKSNGYYDSKDGMENLEWDVQKHKRCDDQVSTNVWLYSELAI